MMLLVSVRKCLCVVAHVIKKACRARRLTGVYAMGVFTAS